MASQDESDYNWPGRPISTTTTSNAQGEKVLIYRYADGRINEVTYGNDQSLRGTWKSVKPKHIPWREKPFRLLREELPFKTIGQQAQSCFFSRLPLEIRNQIYLLVLQQYEEKSQAYPSDAFYWRPSFEAPWYVDTAILYTCRLAYHEAALLTISNAVHFIWGETECPKRTEGLTGTLYMNCTSGLGLPHFPYIRHLRCFGIFDGLQHSLPLHMSYPLPPEEPRALSPETIHFVIAHTNWLDWEYGVDPSLYEDGVAICTQSFPASVKEFRVTFESIDIFKHSIDLVAHLAKSKWKLSRKDDVKLSAEGIPLIVERPWKGPHSSRLIDRWQNINHLPPNHLEIEELTYYGVTVTFRPEKTYVGGLEECSLPNIL